MPVKKNRHYNDPAIGAAFDNLASMFKVPSGSDLSGYANAAATRAKSQRLSDMFDYSQRPDYNRETADRMGIAAGAWAPNQSYYSVDHGNATSRANNTADNVRAREVALINERGNTDRAMLTPIGAGQTRFVPPTLADMYAVPQYQVGAIESKPGEITTAPDGRIFRGDPKPLSLDETKAREMQGLRASGNISDGMMRAAIFGNTPLETVQTPDGPRNVFRPDAVGQAPLPDQAKQSELSILQGERDRLRSIIPNDPKIAEYNNRIQALGRGQQQDEYSKGIDKSMVELGEGVFKNAQTAYSNVATLDRLDQLLGQVGNDQGKFASVKTEIRRALNSLGIEAGDTSPAEVVQALANRFALQLRDPSSGAGMPGAMSDSDREFLRSMIANIDKSPRANQMILEVYRRMNQRTVDLEKMRRDYVKQNGRLDEGFRSQISDFALRNSLFPASAQPERFGVGSSTAGQPVRVNSPAEARKLPSGTPIILPDGSEGRVP
jgi:hypothetical protein